MILLKNVFFTSNILIILGYFIEQLFLYNLVFAIILSFILGVYILPICPKPSKNSCSRGHSEDIRFRKKYRNTLFILEFIAYICLLNNLWTITASICSSIVIVFFIVSNFGEKIINSVNSILK